MRVSALHEFRLDIQRAPAAVALWALDWVESARAAEFTFADLTAKAQLLQSRRGNVYSHRRRGHRLIFIANAGENTAIFVAVRKREDVYEVAAERIGEKR